MSFERKVRTHGRVPRGVTIVVLAIATTLLGSMAVAVLSLQDTASVQVLAK